MENLHKKIVETVDRFGTEAKRLHDGLAERIEIIEASGDRPRAANDPGTSDQREHKGKFLDWIRRPRDGVTKRILEEAESELSKKNVVIGTDASGGYAVPTLIASEIERRVQTQNVFRQLINVVTVGSTDYKKLVSKNQAGSGWAGEGGTRSETDTSDLVAATPTWGVLYAYPKASEESMQDIYFDVGAWLAEEAGDAFASAEATAIWSGNGTSKPSGLKNTTPTTDDDSASPERAATALKYLSLASVSPVSISGDSLIDMVYDLKSAYLQGPGVGWVMNRTTAREIRQLKDSYGSYIWERSAQAGQPEMLFGFPVFLTDAMDAATTNLFPVAFGNFKRAYEFAVHASGLRITVDDSITTPGQTKFYIRRRVGGIVSNNEAVRLLKYADS